MLSICRAFALAILQKQPCEPLADLVERTVEKCLESMAAQEREQSSLAKARFSPPRNKISQLGAISEQPFESTLEVGELIEKLRLEGLDREERYESNHGPELEQNQVITGQIQHVVEELVLFVSESRSVAKIHLR